MSGAYKVIDDQDRVDLPATLHNLIIAKTAKRTKPSPPPARTSQVDGTSYGRAALDCELAELRAAMDGARNDTLNRTTFAVAQLVAGGELPQEPTMQLLREAAHTIGLEERETERTIDSAWSKGIAEPRNAPVLGSRGSDRTTSDDPVQSEPDHAEHATPPPAATPPKPTAGDLIGVSFITAEDLRSLPPLPRVPLVGPKVLDSGCYGILYGQDGAGKSLATLHLCAAIASGRPWLGLETCGPYPAAYIQVDDDRDELNLRLEAILRREGIDTVEVRRRIYTLARPFPWGSLIDLVEPKVQDSLIAFVRDNGVRVLALDHMSMMHNLPAYDYRPLIEAANRIAEEGECAPLFLAHPSKAGYRSKEGEAGADDVYGDSRFRNCARLRVRFARIGHQIYRARFEKVSRGVAPAPIELGQDARDPSLYVTQVAATASAAKAERIARIVTLLEAQPNRSMTGRALAIALGVDERTLRRYTPPPGVTQSRLGFSLDGTGEA